MFVALPHAGRHLAKSLAKWLCLRQAPSNDYFVRKWLPYKEFLTLISISGILYVLLCVMECLRSCFWGDSANWNEVPFMEAKMVPFTFNDKQGTSPSEWGTIWSSSLKCLWIAFIRLTYMLLYSLMKTSLLSSDTWFLLCCRDWQIVQRDSWQKQQVQLNAINSLLPPVMTPVRSYLGCHRARKDLKAMMSSKSKSQKTRNKYMFRFLFFVLSVAL